MVEFKVAGLENRALYLPEEPVSWTAGIGIASRFSSSKDRSARCSVCWLRPWLTLKLSEAKDWLIRSSWESYVKRYSAVGLEGFCLAPFTKAFCIDRKVCLGLKARLDVIDVSTSNPAASLSSSNTASSLSTGSGDWPTVLYSRSFRSLRCRGEPSPPRGYSRFCTWLLP